MSRIALIRRAQTEWPAILRAAKAKGFRFDVKPPTSKDLRMLGTSTKIRYGESVGVLTAVMYLSPAKESGVDLCPFRGKSGCERSCIGAHTGLLAMPSSKLSRLWKTALVVGAPDLAHELLACEVRAHVRKAERLGLMPAVRLDGSSDLGLGGKLAATWGNVCRFYDYTKSDARAFASLGSTHHVTLSFHGANLAHCAAYLRAGGTVAVVFPIKKGEPLPATWHGFPVLNGDEHDARFLDSPGHVVGLSFKRASKRDKFLEQAQSTGFVQLRKKGSHV
jgi:hypothetical protein